MKTLRLKSLFKKKHRLSFNELDTTFFPLNYEQQKAIKGGMTDGLFSSASLVKIGIEPLVNYSEPMRALGTNNSLYGIHSYNDQQDWNDPYANTSTYHSFNEIIHTTPNNNIPVHDSSKEIDAKTDTYYENEAFLKSTLRSHLRELRLQNVQYIEPPFQLNVDLTDDTGKPYRPGGNSGRIHIPTIKERIDNIKWGNNFNNTPNNYPPPNTWPKNSIQLDEVVIKDTPLRKPQSPFNTNEDQGKWYAPSNSNSPNGSYHAPRYTPDFPKTTPVNSSQVTYPSFEDELSSKIHEAMVNLIGCVDLVLAGTEAAAKTLQVSLPKFMGVAGKLTPVGGIVDNLIQMDKEGFNKTDMTQAGLGVALMGVTAFGGAVAAPVVFIGGVVLFVWELGETHMNQSNK